MASKQIKVSLPEDLKDWVEERAEKQYDSVSSVVRGFVANAKKTEDAIERP